MPESSGTPEISFFPSVDPPGSSEAVHDQNAPEAGRLGNLEFLPTDPFPAVPWQQVPAEPLVHHTASQSSQPAATLGSTRQVATRYPLSAYTHWTRVFLMRLYPVFPVIDPGCLLSKLSLTRDAVPRSMAGFFAAMSAAVIVQLNLSTSVVAPENASFASISMGSPTQIELPFSLADKYIAECIKERQNTSFIDDADEWTILESFFMFSYYGNRVKSKQAWYYLREAIGFAISLGLDREESYDDPDLEVNERRRRLYWLLFITERYVDTLHCSSDRTLTDPRAYCLQHRTSTTLRASIALPQIYDGCDEATLRGFISLIKLFISVDSSFVASWCSRSIKSDSDAVLRLLDPEAFSAMSSVTAIDETQRADIAATQCWLHTLAWQLRDHATPASGRGGTPAAPLRKAARSLLFCFSDTRRDAIESHGVGMVSQLSKSHMRSLVRLTRNFQEQKVFDIAGFMCDLLPTLDHGHLTADTDSIPNLLHNFMCLLANFRNQESCYLGPLAERATALLMMHGGGPTVYEPCLQAVEAEGLDNHGEEDQAEASTKLW